MNIHNRNNGFTLVELVTVIVLLGVLSVTAAPKFINFQDDARASTHVATASAFKSAINLVHTMWQIRGGGGAVDEFDIYGQGTNKIDINSNGWPAQSWNGQPEASPSLGNPADCVSVWNQVLQTDSPRAASDASQAYIASYQATGKCTYKLVEAQELTIKYDSLTGQVLVNQ
ncbi:MAG: type II secretion system protein [Parashewanella sp.]